MSEYKYTYLRNVLDVLVMTKPVYQPLLLLVVGLIPITVIVLSIHGSTTSFIILAACLPTLGFIVLTVWLCAMYALYEEIWVYFMIRANIRRRKEKQRADRSKN